MKAEYESILNEYEEKDLAYTRIAMLAEKLKDEELSRLVIKRLVGIKGMLKYMTENKSKYVK